MTAQDAFDEWMAHDEWQFADREACWKFMFEKGKESMRQQLAAALAACKLKDAALKELRRAIGDHYAPNDCYATGPVTGNDYRDLVECPACSASAHYDEALTIQPDASALKAWLGEPVAWLEGNPEGLWFVAYSKNDKAPQNPLYSPKGL